MPIRCGEKDLICQQGANSPLFAVFKEPSPLANRAEFGNFSEFMTVCSVLAGRWN